MELRFRPGRFLGDLFVFVSRWLRAKCINNGAGFLGLLFTHQDDDAAYTREDVLRRLAVADYGLNAGLLEQALYHHCFRFHVRVENFRQLFERFRCFCHETSINQCVTFCMPNRSLTLHPPGFVVLCRHESACNAGMAVNIQIVTNL